MEDGGSHVQTEWDASSDNAYRGGALVLSEASGSVGKGILSKSTGDLGSDSFDIDPEDVAVGENGTFFKSASAPP